MKKQTMFLIMMITIVLFALSACSNEQHHPHERVEQYVSLWHDSNFTDMYDMLTEDTKENFPTEDFIDRYEKIYEDLVIEDLTISYQELSDEQLEQAMENGEVSFPLHVSMNSIAGPIEFSQELDLVLVEDPNEEE